MSKYDFRSPVKLTFVDGQFYPITVRWEIEPDAGSHFLFNSNLLQNDRTQNQVLAFLWTIPLFVQYANSELLERGSVMVNLGDIGFVPGLAFCDNRPDYFLVPDNLFISSRGYERTRLALREKEIPWNQRHATALWRGTTTGHPSDRSVGWRSLPRVGLCAISQRHQEFIDAGITRATQVASQSPPEVEAEIRASGIWKSFVPVDEFSQYKYQIDIDGNTNSWPGLFQKLLTGSAVLKVTSPSGHRQWYYDRLRPWYNYVPISSNLSDLVDKIRWLKLHDEVAQRIGSAGRELAETATLETELKQAVHTITAALRSSAYAAAGSLTTDSDLKPENVGAG